MTTRGAVVWVCEESGWYTCDLGGICHEADGWYVYPKASPETFGPFRTLQQAKRAAEHMTREA